MCLLVDMCLLVQCTHARMPECIADAHEDIVALQTHCLSALQTHMRRMIQDASPPPPSHTLCSPYLARAMHHSVSCIAGEGASKDACLNGWWLAGCYL
jgi:hypothetical protein